MNTITITRHHVAAKRLTNQAAAAKENVFRCGSSSQRAIFRFYSINIRIYLIKSVDRFDSDFEINGTRFLAYILTAERVNKFYWRIVSQLFPRT